MGFELALVKGIMVDKLTNVASNAQQDLEEFIGGKLKIRGTIRTKN